MSLFHLSSHNLEFLSHFLFYPTTFLSYFLSHNLICLTILTFYVIILIFLFHDYDILSPKEFLSHDFLFHSFVLVS